MPAPTSIEEQRKYRGAEAGEESLQTATVGFRMLAPDGVNEGNIVEFKPTLSMRDRGKGPFEIDAMFPLVMKGPAFVWGADEGFAAMLQGMVRALKPQVALETGTNRGRSTRAIAEGLHWSQRGHLTTVDFYDQNIYKSGAIPDDLAPFVTAVVGELPAVFEQEPLVSMKDIDFAYLDAGHTIDELVADMEFVESHRAEECVVLVDNARDEGWPDITEYFSTYDKHPHVSLDTMCGMQIIQMRG